MKGKLKKVLAIFLALTLLSADICAIAEAVATLSLPSALQIIDESAFYGDTSIDKVVVPDGTVEIRRKAFANSSLKELVLPDTIEYIASDAFDGCEDVSVIVPEGCYAYNRCVALGLIKPMLDAPGNVAATVVSESALNISWTAVEGADGYYIISDGEVVGDVYGENTCSFMWQGLEPNTLYKASVKAYYFKNNGEESIGYESASVSCRTAAVLSVSATVANSELTLSESISVNAAVSGNYGDFTYRYTIKKGAEVVAASGASTAAQYSYVPVAAGNYSVVVVVTDSLGRSASCQIDGITVNATALELDEAVVDKSVIMLGEAVMITANSNRPAENLTYSANVYRDDIKVDQIVGVGKLTYTPDAVGTYSFAIEITDNYGETGYAHLSNAVTVRPYWVLTGVTTNVSSASVGDAITITAVTEGDTTNTKLTYTIYKDAAVYRQITDVTQTEYAFYANDVGTYSCICTAKDAYNNEVSVSSSDITVSRKTVVNSALGANHGNTLNVDELYNKTVRIDKKDTTITWDKLSGDSYYVLEIGCSKLGTDIVYDEKYKGNSYAIPASQLAPGYEYDVSVDRYDTSGKYTGWVYCDFIVTGGESVKLESSPKLIVPAEDASVNHDDLTIQWTQMNYAESIDIILEYDCGHTDHEILRETVNGNTTTYTIPKSVLQSGKEHYVRIIARDSLGYNKSTDAYFYVGCEGEEDVREIEEPVLNNSYMSDGYYRGKVPTYSVYEPILISWDANPYASFFSLHLEDYDNDDKEIVYSNIKANSYTVQPSALVSGHRYRVEVYAHHTDSCYEKSEDMWFRAPYKGNLLLDPPKVTSPDLSLIEDDPTVFVQQDVTVVWEPVTAAVSYDVTLNCEADDSIDFEKTGLTKPTVTIPKSSFCTEEEYSLHGLIIEAYDSNGNSTYEKYYIRTVGSTITAPTLLYPSLPTDDENMPAYPEKDLTLIWNVVEGAVEYRVQVRDYYGEEWDVVIDEQGIKDEEFTIPEDELYLGGRFKVRIKAIDQYGNGKYSPNYYFQIGSSAYMDLTLSDHTFDYEGGSKNFFIQTSQEWTAKCSDSWISVSKTSGDASMQLTVTTKENPGDFPRSGSVTFTNSAGGCAVFSVTQDGNGSSNTGALKITSPEQGETIDYAKFRTYWDYNYDHAYYTVALYDVTSGKTVYTNDMETLEYDDIPQSALTYGHIYQLTVAVYNAQYSKISQSSIVFRVESLSSGGSQTNPDDGDDGVIEDTEIPEGANDIVYVGIENGAEIQKKDLSISWQNVIGADRYWVALRDMTLYPDDKYTSEEAKKVIDQETLLNVNILEGQLTEGHAYRLWIGAYGMDDEDPLCQKSISFTVAKAAEEGDEPENTDTGIPTATLKLASDEVVLGDSIALQGVVRANGGALDQVRVTIQDAQTGAFCDYAIYDQAGIASFGSNDSFDLSNIPAIPTNMTIHESGSSEARPASTSIDLSTAGNRYNIIVYARNSGSETMTSLASVSFALKKPAFMYVKDSNGNDLNRTNAQIVFDYQGNCIEGDEWLYLHTNEDAYTLWTNNDAFNAEPMSVEYRTLNEKIVKYQMMLQQNPYGAERIIGIKAYNVWNVTDESDGDERVSFAIRQEGNPNVVDVSAIEMLLERNRATVSDKVHLSYTLQPTNATFQDVVWKSSNTDVATIGQNAWLSAVGIGTATITVSSKKYPWISDSITIEVVEELYEEVINTEQHELWKKLTSRGDIENSYLFLSLPKYTFEEMGEGSWTDRIYVGSYSQYSQVVDSWFDYSTQYLVLEKLHNYIKREDYVVDVFAQMIIEYIYNFDAEASLSSVGTKDILEGINQLMPGVHNVLSTVELTELAYEIYKVIKGVSSVESAMNNLTSHVLSVIMATTEETMNQIIARLKAFIVRERIEAGIGDIDSLPSQMRNEVNALLDAMTDELQSIFIIGKAAAQQAYVLAIDTVIGTALDGAGAVVGFPILGKVLIGLKNGMGTVVDSMHIKEIGLGLEYVLISKEMVKNSEKELLRAARCFAANPTDINYASLNNHINAYRTYAATAIYWYYAWQVLEADYDISNWLPGGTDGEEMKANAKLTYENDMSKLIHYMDGI